MDLSVVVPVYMEEKNISEFLRRVQLVLYSLTSNYEIIFCLDPSPDRTAEMILEHNQIDNRIKLIKFSRRFGQPMATLGGLQYSTGKAVVVIDVDLQDPPELIAEMYKKWQAGFDVVYAQRTEREGENFIKIFISFLGYKFINKISNVNIPPNTGDFRLMSKRVVDEVLKLKESHGFLRGLVALVGFKQTVVFFKREARLHGKSHYNRFFGSLKIALNGVVCFSSYLLSLSSILGFLTSFLSFITALIYFIMKIMHFPFPIGNPTIVILILFMGGVQLISVGILGEYISRIYDEVKQRPRFIVDEKVGF